MRRQNSSPTLRQRCPEAATAKACFGKEWGQNGGAAVLSEACDQGKHRKSDRDRGGGFTKAGIDHRRGVLRQPCPRPTYCGSCCESLPTLFRWPRRRAGIRFARPASAANALRARHALFEVDDLLTRFVGAGTEHLHGKDRGVFRTVDGNASNRNARRHLNHR